jgi:signal transduction histidine kinase
LRSASFKNLSVTSIIQIGITPHPSFLFPIPSEMPYADVNLPVTTDYRLIALSVVISYIGSYTALDIADQSIFTPQQLPPRVLTFGSGLSLGMTVWTMHFTAILAHTLPIPINYDFNVVLLSMGVSIVGAIAGMWTIRKFTLIRWAIAGVGIGSSIIAMHYMAMTSIRMAAVLMYDFWGVLLSGTIAISAALASLWALFHIQRSAPVLPCRHVLISTLFMGTAISGLHFTAMISTHVRSIQSLGPQSHGIDTKVVAIVIGVAALLILKVALLASYSGRRLNGELVQVEALQQSEARLEELVRQRTQELEQEKLASEAANQSKTAFLSNTSHELRTPLTSIIGFSSVLLEQIFGPLNSRQLEYVQRISDAGYHLLSLIDDLLDLARIEAGRTELLLESVSVEEICRNCIVTVQKQAEQKGLPLLLSIAPDVTTCMADKRRLTQILLNLLSNGIKFTEVGSVTLQVSQTADQIQFAVVDTGIGISKTDQATLFQPFQQVDNSFARRYEGTGLGLALSQKLARLHGGEITIESDVNQGSRFTLFFPLSP